MNCARCNGLMYRIDLLDKQGHARIEAWVCLMCGEVLDPVILRNRSDAIDAETMGSPVPGVQSGLVQAAG
jgi:hypothetical protein